MNHDGFAFINVFSPCVTFNKINTYDWFKENITETSEIPGYDPSDRVMAMTKIMETKGMLTGLIYQNTEKKSYQQLIPGFKEEGIAKQDIQLTEEQFNELLAEFR